jgi:hypothetical protein
MADALADDLIKRQSDLAQMRSEWEPDWQDATIYVIPQEAFSFGISPRGRTRSQVVDDTAKDCLDNLVAGLEGLLWGDRAYEVRTKRESMMRDEGLKAWCEEATRVLNGSLANPRAGFSPERQKALRSIGGLGTGCLYSEDNPGRHLVFRSIPLAQLTVAEDSSGVVDTVFRRFSMSARQAAQKFGEQALSDQARRILEKEPYSKIEFLHAVFPRGDYDGERRDRLNLPFADHYVEFDTRHHVSEGGYHEMPYHVGRWDGVHETPYGWCPTMNVMDEIKRVNTMGRTNLKAGHSTAEPALYIRNGLFKGKPLDRRPNSVNYYTPDRGENTEVRALPGPNGLPVTLEMEQDRREFIRAAFYYYLLQIPQNPQMTATEWLGRVQEMMRRMGRPVGNIQTEVAQPAGERAFSVLLRAGAISPPPAPLTREDVTAEFLSPLKRAQRAAEAEGTLRTVQGIGAIAGLDPSVGKILNGEKAVRHLREANGAPADILRSEREMRAQREQDAQAAAMQNMASLAEQGAGIVHDLSEAASNAPVPQY